MAYNTISDYILNAQTTLQELTKSNSIQLSSVGVIGNILTLLANNQYNHKLYHDSQMLNTNILTATDDKNLIYLGSLQGYKRKFATPSTLNGIINFGSFILSTQLPTNIDSRKITIINPDITIGSVSFQSSNTYTITIFRSSNTLFYNIDILSNGKLYSYDINNLGITENAESVRIYNTLQYETQITTINIPYYDLNSTYTRTLKLNKKQIYLYSIKINSVSYTLVSDKIGYNSSSKIIFYSYDLNNDLILEFGDGNIGKYLANTTMVITLQLTLGSYGNIGSSTSGILSADKITIVDYDINNVAKSTYTKNISELISYSVVNSTNGVNILSKELLRTDIIKFIQTNTYLISYQDYKNMIQLKYSICEFLFKKINLLSNEIFFYFPIYNSTLLPISTICLNIADSIFNPNNLKLLINPETTVVTNASKTFISPFSYLFDNFNKKYLSCIFDNDIVVQLINKEKYVDTINYICPNFTFRLLYDVTLNITTIFIPKTTQYNLLDYNIYLSFLPNSTYDVLDNNGDYTTVSLSFSNIYTLLIPLISKESGYGNDQFMPTEYVPVFRTNSNDGINSETLMYGNSTNDFKGYFYKIPDYIQNKVNIKIKIKKKISTISYDYLVTFDSVSQVTILGSQFELKKMIYPNDVSNTEYVFCIPFMEKSDYDVSNPQGLINKKYIDQTLLSNIDYFNTLIPSYKSPTDDIQYRFLNSTKIKSTVASIITRQKYNFDIILPIQLSISLVLNNDYIINNNIDIELSITAISNIIIAFLKNKIGTVVSLYPSDIINILADYKYIKSITVLMYDSYNIVLNSSHQLTTGIDTFSVSECESKLLKTSNINSDFLEFTPILFWFDYNSVLPSKINVSYY